MKIRMLRSLGLTRDEIQAGKEPCLEGQVYDLDRPLAETLIKRHLAERAAEDVSEPIQEVLAVPVPLPLPKKLAQKVERPERSKPLEK